MSPKMTWVINALLHHTLNKNHHKKPMKKGPLNFQVWSYFLRKNTTIQIAFHHKDQLPSVKLTHSDCWNDISIFHRKYIHRLNPGPPFSSLCYVSWSRSVTFSTIIIPTSQRSTVRHLTSFRQRPAQAQRRHQQRHVGHQWIHGTSQQITPPEPRKKTGRILSIEILVV